MRINKVKVTNDDRIHVEYMGGSDGKDEFAFTCKQAPLASFYTALENLKPHVIDMCELPNDYIDRIAVRGVSFSYGGENEVMGATIIAQMRLKHSNVDLNLNTPHKASESYSESEAAPEQLLTETCINDLNVLLEEAEKYVNGERAQLDLFDGGSK